MKSTINSGVFVKDMNAGRNVELGYYGVLNEIIELEYHNTSVQHTRVVLFKCDWFDSTKDRGVKYHRKTGIVSVNRRRKYHQYDPFILAQQAQQVYYCNYPGAKRDRADWLAVVKVRPRYFAIPEIHANEDQDIHAFQEDSMNVTTVQPSPDDLPPLCGEECETIEVTADDVNEDFEDEELEHDDYETSDEEESLDDINDDDDDDGDDDGDAEGVGEGEYEDDDA